MTMWSYCSHTQRREHRSGEPTSALSASAGEISTPARASSAASIGDGGVGTQGRSYSGASATSGGTGMSQTTSPPDFSTSRLVSVTLPMIAKSSSHFSKIARAMSSRPGLTTMSMRSWLSDSMIS